MFLIKKKRLLVSLLVICIFSLNFVSLYPIDQSIGIANDVSRVDYVPNTNDASMLSDIDRRFTPVLGVVVFVGILVCPGALMGGDKGTQNEEGLSFSERHKDLDVSTSVDLFNLD